jgi:hypothetical protein
VDGEREGHPADRIADEVDRDDGPKEASLGRMPSRSPSTSSSTGSSRKATRKLRQKPSSVASKNAMELASPWARRQVP